MNRPRIEMIVTPESASFVQRRVAVGVLRVDVALGYEMPSMSNTTSAYTISFSKIIRVCDSWDVLDASDIVGLCGPLDCGVPVISENHHSVIGQANVVCSHNTYWTA